MKNWKSLLSSINLKQDIDFIYILNTFYGNRAGQMPRNIKQILIWNS